ncbi:hypothetical protein [Marinobacterium aestuariivivens]|uniref:DUF2383 domain-containing protein n=1 Tax=Marinobacterium aestuariivivens TaxID=1698799 RepID=A0ABW1ZYL1_9GAMM
MKSFETIRDVVDNAIATHRGAEALYRQLRQRSEDQRAQILLDFMIKHEQQMETSLANLRKSGSDGVLGTYIQYTLEEPPKSYMASLEAEFPSPTADQVCDIGLRVDGYLVELFEGARKEIDAPKAIDYLKDLMDLEALERRKLSQTLNSLHDL